MSKAIGGVSRALFGGSDSSSQQAAQQSSGLDPRVFALMQENYGRAKNTANQLGARQFAGFSGLQNQGFNALSGINQNAGMKGAQSALGQLQSMGFGANRINPMMVRGSGYNASLADSGEIGDASMMGAANINRGDIRNVMSQNFLQGDIGAYMNPYTNQVIDQSLADNDRARLMQQQGINAQALSRGAFGGSRQAIAETENNRNFMDQQARTGAQLRSQGFDTAAALMQNDMNRGLQAQQANQSADFNTASQNAGFMQQANSANQAAQNQFALQRYSQDANTSQFNAANQTAASQFGADAANRAMLANQSAGLSAQSANANNQLQAQQLRSGALSNALSGGLQLNNSFLGNINAQMQGGAMQQELSQQRLDALRNLPLEQLQVTSGALGLNPFGGAGNTSQGTSQGTSRAGSDKGLFGFLF